MKKEASSQPPPWRCHSAQLSPKRCLQILKPTLFNQPFHNLYVDKEFKNHVTTSQLLLWKFCTGTILSLECNINCIFDFWKKHPFENSVIHVNITHHIFYKRKSLKLLQCFPFPTESKMRSLTLR